MGPTAHSQDGWPVVDVAPEDVCLGGGLDEVSHIRAPDTQRTYNSQQVRPPALPFYYQQSASCAKEKSPIW
jgi:hypothetical protein